MKLRLTQNLHVCCVHSDTLCTTYQQLGHIQIEISGFQRRSDIDFVLKMEYILKKITQSSFNSTAAIQYCACSENIFGCLLARFMKISINRIYFKQVSVVKNTKLSVKRKAEIKEWVDNFFPSLPSKSSCKISRIFDTFL